MGEMFREVVVSSSGAEKTDLHTLRQLVQLAVSLISRRPA